MKESLRGSRLIVSWTVVVVCAGCGSSLRVCIYGELAKHTQRQLPLAGHLHDKTGVIHQDAHGVYIYSISLSLCLLYTYTIASRT